MATDTILPQTDTPVLVRPTLPEINARSLYQFMLEYASGNGVGDGRFFKMKDAYGTRKSLALLGWITDYVISLYENRGKVDAGLDEQVKDRVLEFTILINDTTWGDVFGGSWSED